MLKTDPGAQRARRPIGLGSPPVPNDHGAYATLLGFFLGTVPCTAANMNPSASWLHQFIFTLFAVSLICLFFASEPVSVAFSPRAGTAHGSPPESLAVAGNITPGSWPRWRSATLCLEVVYFMGTLFNVRAWVEANKHKKGGVADP